VDLLIVSVGLLIACCGVVLAWQKKGGLAIWATFTFGFLLVLIGGPLRGNISGVTVGTKGLQLSFSSVTQSPDQAKALEATVRASIASLAPTKRDSSTADAQQTLDKTSQVVIDQLLPFIRSLGYVPTPIVGAIQVAPGSIVTLEEGRPSVMATPSEAFPNLAVYTSGVAFPRFAAASEVPGSRSEKVDVEFQCREGVEAVEASLTSLERTADVELVGKLSDSREYFLVQSIMRCNGLTLQARTVSNDPDGSDKRAYDYSTANTVVLGYKLLRFSSSRSTGR
jgi:hypothetical protein